MSTDDQPVWRWKRLNVLAYETADPQTCAKCGKTLAPASVIMRDGDTYTHHSPPCEGDVA